MQVATVIYRMYPHATPKDFEVIRYPDDSWEITRWGLSDSKPSKEQIEAYWNEHQVEILESQQPKPSDIEILKQENAKLNLAIIEIYEMLLGVS